MVDTIRLKPKDTSTGTIKIEKKRESTGFLKFAFLVVAAWVPYWLWAESSIPIGIKHAIRDYLGDDCSGTEGHGSSEGASTCRTDQIQFVSANIGLISSHITAKIAASKSEPSQTRYFRANYNFSKGRWVVSKEIRSSDYYLAY